MNVPIETHQLLKKVSAERSLHIHMKIPSYESEKKRAHMQRFLSENAPQGVLQAMYWLDGKTGGVRSKPNVNTLSWGMAKASEGHILVDVNVGVETLCILRSSGPDGNELADKVCDRVNLWDYITMELATEEEKAIQQDWQGAVEPLIPSRIPGPLRNLRSRFKMAFFRVSYGMHTPKKEDDYEAQEAVLQRLLTRWPGLWLTGTKEVRQAVVLKYRQQATEVWLQVALEAENLGCQVAGFWQNEPIIECKANEDAADFKRQLEDTVYKLMSNP